MDLNLGPLNFLSFKQLLHFHYRISKNSMAKVLDEKDTTITQPLI